MFHWGEGPETNGLDCRHSDTTPIGTGALRRSGDRRRLLPVRRTRFEAAPGDGEVPPGVVAATAGEHTAADLDQTVGVAAHAAHFTGVAMVASGVFAETDLAPGLFGAPSSRA